MVPFFEETDIEEINATNDALLRHKQAQRESLRDTVPYPDLEYVDETYEEKLFCLYW